MQVTTKFPTGFKSQPVTSVYLRREAKSSTCMDRKVGAVILSKDPLNMFPIAKGFNYTTCDNKCLKLTGGVCPAVHAEVMAVDNYLEELRSPDSSCPPPEEVILAVNYAPCKACIQYAEDAGIDHIVVTDTARHTYLTDALEHVRAYHGRLGYPKLTGDQEDKYRQAREIMLAMHMEVAELTDSFQWKPWRATRNYAHHNMLEECSDILFFMDSLLMLFDMDWPDVADAILDKVEVTDNRIKEGYHK